MAEFCRGCRTIHPSLPERKQINISVFDELRRLDTELSYEIVSLTRANFWRLTVVKDNLQLEEVTQVLDLIEVHSRTSDHEQRAMLLYSTVSDLLTTFLAASVSSLREDG